MKGLVLFLSALCLSEDFCKGQNSYQDVEDQIVHYVSVHGNKGYHFQYKTKNGIEREETGKVDANDNLEVQGNYAYFSPEGLKIENSYHAGKDGFRPSLRFIPTNQAEFKKTTTITSKLPLTVKKEDNLTKEPKTIPLTAETKQKVVNLPNKEASSEPTLPTLSPTFSPLNKNDSTSTTLQPFPPLPPLPPLPPRTTTVPPPPLDISSAAIASLAGGGLG
ncbi:unnamed protein product [Brassicogethes aeneus]|uniref:Uncharacterized protein n=1 Tax=Brassicogethes aeneus TaxID=1431903 RepID=A0A9P0B8Z3_BRAAE|nr:unnamed protein product [Brassicogethes aeneus]